MQNTLLTLPLIGNIIWRDERIGAINRRIKSLLSYYANSIQFNNAMTIHLRKVVMILAKVCETIEYKEEENEIKGLFVDALMEKIKAIQPNCSTKRLMSEMYLLEPQWLSCKLSTGLVNKLCKDHYLGSFDERAGLRAMVNHIKQIEIITEIDTPESPSTVPMEIDANQNLQKKTVPKNKKNQYGETQLHISAKKADGKKLKMILEGGPVDINCRDNNGWTPLHEACFKGDFSNFLKTAIFL